MGGGRRKGEGEGELELSLVCHLHGESVKGLRVSNLLGEIKGLSRDGEGPGLVVRIYIVPVPDGHCDICVHVCVCVTRLYAVFLHSKVR